MHILGQRALERWFCHRPFGTMQQSGHGLSNNLRQGLLDLQASSFKFHKMDVPQSHSKILLLMVVPSLVHHDVPRSLRHDDGSHMLSMVVTVAEFFLAPLITTCSVSITSKFKLYTPHVMSSVQTTEVPLHLHACLVELHRRQGFLRRTINGSRH